MFCFSFGSVKVLTRRQRLEKEKEEKKKKKAAATDPLTRWMEADDDWTPPPPHDDPPVPLHKFRTTYVEKLACFLLIESLFFFTAYISIACFVVLRNLLMTRLSPRPLRQKRWWLQRWLLSDSNPNWIPNWQRMYLVYLLMF